MANIVFGFADSGERELNTSMWRCFTPADILREAGHICAVKHIGLLFSSVQDEKTIQAIEEAEVIVLERLLLKPFHETIINWRKSGKRVYCTFDDNYELMPKSGMPSYATWLGGERPRNAVDDLLERHGQQRETGLYAILNEFKEGLGLVDGALVPSKILQNDCQKYCQQIH